MNMNPKNIFLLSLNVFFFFFFCLGSCEGKRKRYDDGGDEGTIIKGMFVFGSSLVDNGNNNFLEKSSAKADYLPYGIDLAAGPSGRFTNGKNVIDLLGTYLGLPSSIPPFFDPSTKGTNIVRGVNYASGGSGILDDTGSIAVITTFLLLIIIIMGKKLNLKFNKWYLRRWISAFFFFF